MLLIDGAMRKNLFRAGALAVAIAASAAAQETPVRESYIPVGIYPAVYVFAGRVAGYSYDAAPDITGRARAYGLDVTLEDVGATPAVGVGFDFFLYEGLVLNVSWNHAFAGRREVALGYRYENFPKMKPPIPDWTLKEALAYDFQNVAAGAGVKYFLLPKAVFTPYGGAGLTLNSTIIRAADRVSDPILQKSKDGLLLANGRFQRFAFGWGAAAGGRVLVGDHLFFTAEYAVAKPFATHYVAGYKYHLSTTAVNAGVGWRFL